MYFACVKTRIFGRTECVLLYLWKKRWRRQFLSVTNCIVHTYVHAQMMSAQLYKRTQPLKSSFYCTRIAGAHIFTSFAKYAYFRKPKCIFVSFGPLKRLIIIILWCLSKRSKREERQMYFCANSCVRWARFYFDCLSMKCDFVQTSYNAFVLLWHTRYVEKDYLSV